MSHEMTEEEDPEQQLDEDSLPQMELVENNWSLVLMQTVNSFRLNGIGCDVMLLSEEGSPLEAHSLILKAGSPYFKQVRVSGVRSSEGGVTLLQTVLSVGLGLDQCEYTVGGTLTY